MSDDLEREMVQRIAALERRAATIESLESGPSMGNIDLTLDDNLARTAALSTRNNARRAIFDPATLEYIRWSMTLPADTRSNTAITVTLVWATTNANTGKVAWNVLYRLAAPGSAVPGSDTTLATIVSAGNHTQNVIQTTTFTIPASSSVAANGVLVLQVQRDAAHAGDTYTKDCELYGVNVRFARA